MPTTSLMPLPKQAFQSALGTPLIGGKVYTYAAGTNNPKAAYTDAAGTVPHTNPIILNVRGEPPAPIFWAGNYRVELRDALNNLIYSVDNYNTDPANVWNRVTDLEASVLGVKDSLGILSKSDVSILDKRFAGGADPTGQTDSTTAIQAAVDYWITNGGRLLAPYGLYSVKTIKIKDAVYTRDMHSDGAVFIGNATVPCTGVVDIVNCVDFNITGCMHILVQNNTNYDAGMYVRAETGTSQATSRVNIYNVTVRNAKIGFAIGTYTIDYQCSEINFFGCSTFKCPGGVYIGGSQTGASFNGCNLISELNPAFATAPNRVIWMEGGFVTITGGEVVMAETFGATAILLNPCQSVTYGNLYPILRITGAHIETGSQLAAIANNRALATPDSRSANFAVLNCGGYVSGNAAAQDFVYIGDATYVGAVSFALCNFYSDVARTAYNISSAAPGVRITVDSVSFGRNFKHWFGGVYSGTIQHGLKELVFASGIGTNIPTGEQALKFTNIATDGEYARHGIRYVNGAWTVLGGIKTIHVDINLVGGNGPVGTGDFYLKKNGAIVAFGQYINGVANMSAVVHNLVDGDVLTPYLSATAANTFDGASYQYISISGSTTD